MSKALRLLIVEDRASDAELMLRELRRAGFEPDCQRVETEAEFLAALATLPELILSDYALPHFDGLSALALLRARALDIPFILVSGTLGEEAVVEAMKRGATDFLLKDRVSGLGSAVERALEQKRLRDERRLVEDQLAASERQLRAIFDTEPECVKLLTEDGSLLKMNQAGLAFIEADSFAQVANCSVYPLIADAHQAAFRAMVADAFSGATGQLEFQLVGLKGGRRWLETRTGPLRDGAGAVSAVVGVTRDITERKEHEHKIARLSRIRAVFGGISSAMLHLRSREALLAEACRVAVTHGVFPVAWVVSVDAQTQELQIIASSGADPHASQQIERAVLALPEAYRPAYRVALSGQRIVANDLSIEPTMATLRDQLEADGFRAGASFPLFVGGRVDAVLSLLACERGFFDADEIALLEWLAADLSFALESIDNAARLNHLAYYDALTGLCNASLFQDRLNQMVQSARQDQGRVCVVVIDLEGFTAINDTFGRAVGDQLLRAVGARFSQFLVEPYALGRIGSDTFAAASPRDGEFVATRLRGQMFEALKQPFLVDGREVRIRAQAGIALFPADGEDGNKLFRNAEGALKLAKSTGVRYAYYSSELQARIGQRSALQAQLRTAVETQQFVLHYQPRIDMISGELIGAEALIRWQHPQRGLVGPVEFIALTEESGLIVPIGAWVMETVCAQQAAWAAGGVQTVPIAVNLSSVQFAKSDVLQTVLDTLARHALPPGQLTLELTESAVMDDPQAAAETLLALRKLGVGLALDDFGTGYSSLAHLRRFPFDSVKIDRSFVTEITSNPDDAAIATAIISMAHHLNLKVVAEGVETQGQFNFLRAHQCDEMQGFLFGPAVPTAQFEKQLRSRQRMDLPTPEPADQRTLLLVDDEFGIRAALMRMLRRDGYRILGAASGEEGLQLLAVNKVQVIISDQRMPGMSGTDFLNIVKQLYPDTVRIILSGYSDLTVVTDSVNRGAVFKFLTKPWDDELLREQVRDAFRRYQPQRLATV